MASTSKATRIAQLEALVARYQAKAAATQVILDKARLSKEETAGADAIESGLPEGTEVEFKFGRGEKVRHYTGFVIGSKPQDKGPTLYRVRVGSGFDEEIFKLFGAQIVSHNFVATPVEGADPLDAVTDPVEAVEGNGADPLDFLGNEANAS